MHVLSLTGTQQLATEIGSLRDVDEHSSNLLVASYLHSSLIYCLNENMIAQLKQAMNQSLSEVIPGFDIDTFISEHYPFGLFGLPVWKKDLKTPKKPREKKKDWKENKEEWDYNEANEDISEATEEQRELNQDNTEDFESKTSE